MVATSYNFQNNTLLEYIKSEAGMNAEQFSKYLSLIDHPTQLNLAVDEQSLFFLYKQHLSRFNHSKLIPNNALNQTIFYFITDFHTKMYIYTTVNKLLILKLMPISVTCK